MHGSWNRSAPTGNKIVYLDFDDPHDTMATTMSYVMAADTAEIPSRVWWMRPCGLESDSHGNIYFTSDRDAMPFIGIIYPRSLTGAVRNVAVSHVSLRDQPNPVGTLASITFDLPASIDCSVEPFNPLGVSVVRVLDSWLSAGVHHFEFDTRAPKTSSMNSRLTHVAPQSK